MLQRVWAVVVARIGNAAKSRLSGVLEPAQRRALAQAMLADVLDVCRGAGLAGTLAVVDQAARGLAEGAGASPIADPGSGDMNAAVSLGVVAARHRGATTVLILPGDIPLVGRSDLEMLLEAAGVAPRAVVVGASRDGQGTNGLLLRPPDVIAPGFGPPSVQRHVQLGRAADALTRVRTDLGLALDVDTPADLAALSDASPGPHTAALLARLLQDQALVRP